MKQKKITIKPFLNTYIDPVGVETKRNSSVDIYALYYKVTFNRRNTQLKSYYSIGGYANLNDALNSDIVAFEMKLLTDIIEYETKIQGEEDFNLAGLKTRYEAYSESIYYTFDKYLRNKLWKVVQKTNHIYHLALRFDNYQGKMTILTLLEICDKLFPGFNKFIDKHFEEEINCFQFYHKLYKDKQLDYSFATLIDWVNDSHKDEFIKKSKKMLFDESKTINRYSDIINTVVSERLKNIVLEKTIV